MRTRNGAFVLSSMRSYVRKCNDLLVVNESAQTVVILPHRCIASNNAPSDAGRQRESVRDIALRSNLLVYTHPEIASQFPCIYHSAPNAGTPYVHASSARLHNNLLLRARKTSLYTRLEQALQKYLRPRTQKTRVQQKTRAPRLRLTLHTKNACHRAHENGVYPGSNYESKRFVWTRSSEKCLARSRTARTGCCTWSESLPHSTGLASARRYVRSAVSLRGGGIIYCIVASVVSLILYCSFSTKFRAARALLTKAYGPQTN